MIGKSVVILGRCAKARRAEDLWTEEHFNRDEVLGSALRAARE